jgi:DNA repair protein RecN (Recombination protein N)
VEGPPVAAAYRTWRAAEEALASATAELETAERDREWLEHAVAELTAFGAEPGEEETLAEERSRMQKGARLADDLAAVTDHLDGSGGALTHLRQAARRLDRLAPEHALLADALAAMDRAVIEASEAEDHLQAALSDLSFDPSRLDQIETRLFELRGLARKHRVSPDELAALTDELRTRFERLEAGGAGLAQREAAAQAGADALRRTGGRAECRANEGRRPARPCGRQRIGAAQARCRAVPDGGRARRRGAMGAGWARPRRVRDLDQPGAPFAPLIRIASGGELSRFILALKVALAEKAGLRR